MFKKVLVMILVLAMAISMVACGNKETTSTPSETKATQEGVVEEVTTQVTTQAEVDEVYPAEKVLIGVEVYDPTESSTIALKEYLSYIGETFNVEFKYSEAIADADQEMKFIEDCAIAGAKGFMAYYNVTGVEQISKVLEYDMYYYGSTDDPVRYEAFKDHPLYLGGVSNGAINYIGGGALGEWVLENGFDKVIYANGGANFGVAQFVERQQGFLDALGGSDVEILTVAGFPGEQFFADQGAALSTEGVDAVVASFNGVDFWAQPIATAGLSETVKLGTFGALNDDFVNAFENKTIDLLVSDNIQAFGFLVPIILNAIDGNAEVLQDNGIATNVTTAPWIIDSPEVAKNINDIMKTDRVYTSEDFMKLIVGKNPEANSKTILDIVNLGSLEELAKR